MDNNTIINDRWKYTDNKLKEYLKVYKKVSSKTQDKIQDIFKNIEYDYNDLKKPISTAQRNRLLRVVEDWKKSNLLNGYFKYKVDSIIKKVYITNEEMLELLLWGAYIQERSQLDEYEKILFTEVGTDLYNQGIKEINPIKKKKWSLTWEYIWALLCLPNIKGNSWLNYIEALALTNAQEIQRQTMIQLQQHIQPNINDDVYKNIIRKQQNRYICINDDKISGSLESEIEEIANKSFLKAGEDVGEKKLQARLIAVIDKRTTKMCKSMNNMLFYVNDINKFYRYSDEDKGNKYYEVEGLQLGINLPPISNHFHYCRSTITYQLEENIANEVRDNIKVANEYDKEQYHRYKRILGDDFSYRDVEEFTKMKYNNPSEWAELKESYRTRREIEKYKEKYSNIRHNEDGYIIDTNIWTSHQPIPSRYRKNAVVKTITKTKNGEESIGRNIYDNKGYLSKQVHNSNHGNSKAHPYGKNGEHIHEFIWEDDKIVERIVRELTDDERKENGDIL